MLVCFVSQLGRRATIAAEMAEAAAAADATAIENVGLAVDVLESAFARDAPESGGVVFDTLVDDPASVGDHVDAFLGQNMLEAASAAATVTAGFGYAAAIAEAAAAADLLSSSVPIAGTVAETATAASTQDAAVISGVTYATWDPATVAAVTLSGANLVATNTGTTSTNQGAHVAAASGKTSGKYYCECTMTTFTGGAGVGMGVGNTASTYALLSGSYSGGNMNLAVGHTGTGVITNTSGNSGASLGALAGGDVVGLAVDVTNRRIWFRKGAAGAWNGAGVNGDPTNPVGGGGFGLPSGTIIPFVTFGSGLAGAAGVSGNVITANFGATSFVGAVPSGYTSGWV